MNAQTLEHLKEAESNAWHLFKAASEIAEEKNIQWKAAYRAVVSAKEELKKRTRIETLIMPTETYVITKSELLDMLKNVRDDARIQIANQHDGGVFSILRLDHIAGQSDAYLVIEAEESYTEVDGED